jgi:hypothetical protein
LICLASDFCCLTAFQEHLSAQLEAMLDMLLVDKPVSAVTIPACMQCVCLLVHLQLALHCWLSWTHAREQAVV